MSVTRVTGRPRSWAPQSALPTSSLCLVLHATTRLFHRPCDPPVALGVKVIDDPVRAETERRVGTARRRRERRDDDLCKSNFIRRVGHWGASSKRMITSRPSLMITAMASPYFGFGGRTRTIPCVLQPCADSLRSE